MTQASDNSNRMRVIMAPPSPRTRALCRCWGGSLPTRIEMKMMLSMPSTISRRVNVASAIQALGSNNQSNMSRSCGDEQT